MNLLIAFTITLLAISAVAIRFRISPFFTLVGGAIFYGLLAGLSPDHLMMVVIGGLGKIFGLFAIVILSGAVIAKVLEEQGQVAEIVADIRRYVRNPVTLTGISAYLLALPVACSITAFIILEPVIGNLEKGKQMYRALLYTAAIGSLISFTLIFPTPVTIPLLEALSGGISPWYYDAVAITLSLIFLAGIIILQQKGIPGSAMADQAHPGEKQAKTVHLRAWAPFISIILAIPAGVVIGLSTSSLIQVIMLAGALTALILAPPGARSTGLHRGAKHAGVIIFDICGAGALAAVILASGFAEAALGSISGTIPVLFAPFIFAALIQTAQGSRVVTAVVTSGILAGSLVAEAFHPVALILMIIAGSFIVSYVTDPFFWIVHHATGDDLRTVVRHYTIPLAVSGLFIFCTALLLQVMTGSG